MFQLLHCDSTSKNGHFLLNWLKMIQEFAGKNKIDMSKYQCTDTRSKITQHKCLWLVSSALESDHLQAWGKRRHHQRLCSSKDCRCLNNLMKEQMTSSSNTLQRNFATANRHQWHCYCYCLSCNGYSKITGVATSRSSWWDQRQWKFNLRVPVQIYQSGVYHTMSMTHDKHALTIFEWCP